MIISAITNRATKSLITRVLQIFIKSKRLYIQLEDTLSLCAKHQGSESKLVPESA